MNPNYPIYIVSKGRFNNCLTVRELESMKVPYKIVIEPQEYESYLKKINKDKIIVLPFSNLNQGSIPARNFIWEHSLLNKNKRHWILDDNIEGFHRLNKNMKPKVTSGTIFKIAEDFVERYSNVALAGFILGLAAILKYHAIFLLLFLIPCLWNPFTKSFHVKYFLIVSSVSLSLLATFLIFVHSNFGFWVTPPAFQSIHRLNIQGFVNNFFLYAGYLVLISAPFSFVFFDLSETIKKYKYRLLLLLVLLFLPAIYVFRMEVSLILGLLINSSTNAYLLVCFLFSVHSFLRLFSMISTNRFYLILIKF